MADLQVGPGGKPFESAVDLLQVEGGEYLLQGILRVDILWIWTNL